MSFWSDRGQVEPLAALAAVFAVGVGLSLYVGALDATLPALVPDREVAPVATDRFVDEASVFGAVTPPLDGAAASARPSGYELNATLVTEASRYDAGPPTAGTTDCRTRQVTVRTDPGTVHPGRLEVCVWSAP